MLNEHWRNPWFHIIQNNISVPLPSLNFLLILLNLYINDIKILLFLRQPLIDYFIKRQQLHHYMGIDFHKPHDFFPFKLFDLWLYINVFHITVFHVQTLFICDIIYNFQLAHSSCPLRSLNVLYQHKCLLDVYEPVFEYFIVFAWVCPKMPFSAGAKIVFFILLILIIFISLIFHRHLLYLLPEIEQLTVLGILSGTLFILVFHRALILIPSLKLIIFVKIVYTRFLIKIVDKYFLKIIFPYKIFQVELRFQLQLLLISQSIFVWKLCLILLENHPILKEIIRSKTNLIRQRLNTQNLPRVPIFFAKFEIISSALAKHILLYPILIAIIILIQTLHLESFLFFVDEKTILIIRRVHWEIIFIIQQVFIVRAHVALLWIDYVFKFFRLLGELSLVHNLSHIVRCCENDIFVMVVFKPILGTNLAIHLRRTYC